MTTDHPECLEGKIYLGNFTPEDAKKIGWKSKVAGNKAYCTDGSEYPFQEEYGVRPYFAEIEELQKAGVI